MSGRHCGGGVGPAKYYLSLSAPVVQCQDAAALVVVAHYTNSHNERQAASGSVGLFPLFGCDRRGTPGVIHYESRSG